jgi:hypothetical protein
MKLKRRITMMLFIFNMMPIIFAQIDSSKYLYPDSLASQTGGGFNRVNIDSSPGYVSVDSSKLTPSQTITDILSEKPTVSEINNLFALVEKRERDPFIIATEIASKEDNAIPALEKLVFMQYESSKDGKAAKVFRNQFAIYALDELGTPKAEKILMQVALSHPDKEVKALALKSLTWNYFNRAKCDSTTLPDKEVICVLLQNQGDTTFVNNCDDQISKIAADGIENWVGDNLRSQLKTEIKFKENSGNDEKLKLQCDQWWQINNTKIEWNKLLKHFERN